MKRIVESLHFLRRIILWLSCSVILLSMTGCGNDGFTDLRQYIGEIKARPKGTIQPLPEIKIVEPFIFKPDGLRDPFRPIERVEEQEDIDVGTGGIRPDKTRRKEELESFSLDTLRMVGTLSMKSGLWGLVRTNDSTVHRVQIGNYLGRNYGKINRILEDKIELMEIVPDQPGNWREQQASLALAE